MTVESKVSENFILQHIYTIQSLILKTNLRTYHNWTQQQCRSKGNQF